jgi:hypothetical protein
MPRIRSESPAFDLHHPEVGAHATAQPDDALANLVGPSDLGGKQ